MMEPHRVRKAFEYTLISPDTLRLKNIEDIKYFEYTSPVLMDGLCNSEPLIIFYIDRLTGDLKFIKEDQVDTYLNKPEVIVEYIDLNKVIDKEVYLFENLISPL